MPKSRRSTNTTPQSPAGNSHAPDDFPGAPAASEEALAIHLGDAVPPIDVEVAREAYDLYRERGYADGRDFDDWLEAERRVQRRREATRGGGPGGPPK